jgi:hypothetical protein
VSTSPDRFFRILNVVVEVAGTAMVLAGLALLIGPWLDPGHLSFSEQLFLTLVGLCAVILGALTAHWWERFLRGPRV